jgi:hypothetical protein
MNPPLWPSMVLALALAACGKSNETPPPPVAAPAASAKAKPSGQGAATAEQVAKASRAELRCPAKAAAAPRAAAAPVDDVLGVRPGMGYDEALNTVLCTHDLLVPQLDASRGFNLKTHGQKLRHGFGARFAEPRVEWSAKRAQAEMMDSALARSGNAARDDLKPGQVKWYVGTMGLPGQERVVNVAREERFDTGAQPTLAAVEQALVAKYGPPSRQQNNGGQRHFVWTTDAAGQRVVAGSPLIQRCVGIASPDSGVNLSPDCGTVVTAIVMPPRDNPDLAMTLQVGVVDQAGGYRLVTSTEQALAQVEQQRRAKETANAAKSAPAPKL